LHTIPGRVRVRVPGWSGQGKHEIETRLRQVQGVSRVQANALTRNILICFDSAVTGEQTILESIGSLQLDKIHGPQDDKTSLPPALREREKRTIRARIAVRGMDRDPELARRVVERLERRPGVRANASLLTGRVLVEFAERQADLQDLIADVADVELPPLPVEDRPAYPLDPEPMIHGAVRSIGAALGLGILAMRRAAGMVEPLPGAGIALHAASIIGILQSIPPLRSGLRKLFGRLPADLLFQVPGIATLTLANSPLGLAVAGAESVRLMTEVQARQSSWRRYEERVQHAPPAQPDAVIRLEAGEPSPLAATIIEGTGTAIGRDGMPAPVMPGHTIPPGARLHGGPFLVRLRCEESFQSFTPAARPAPVAPSLYDRYQQASGWFSLAYAGVMAFFTRSFSQTLASLLLVNSRPALVGLEAANLGVSARVTRVGATVVGTRARTIRLPGLLLLDGVRLLTGRLELADALSLVEDMQTEDALSYAASVANAAGSPWGGGIFHNIRLKSAVQGAFDGRVATAVIEGRQFSLGPVEDWSAIPEAAYVRQNGNYVLVLRREGEEKPDALIALRPQLAESFYELAQMCERYGVELAVLAGGDQIAVQSFARRAHITLIDNDDAVNVIRARQLTGALVAFVSDHAGAAAGFETCDLAIGMTDGRSHLPVRADLLAPDLRTVAAIIEAAARREAAVRDAVGLSILSNAIGVVWGLRLPGMVVASRVISVAALATFASGWLRLRGGKRAQSTLSTLVDPRPERWGRQNVQDVLHFFHASEQGLSSAQAAVRQQKALSQTRHHRLISLIMDQVKSPVTALLLGGAALSLLFGALGDAILITGTIVASVGITAWQERKVNRVTEALQHIGTISARVLRDNQEMKVPADEVVPGDILLLAAGDRVAADARILDAQGLEVDEAALTGEALPVSKMPGGGQDSRRIVLEGSDVTSGSGRAVVVAVGPQTRMGATRTALSLEEIESDSLGGRLGRMLHLSVPISLASGVIVIAAGLLWGQPLALLLTTGATIALAGVPEGLPLLAKIGESGVARRLAGEKALVRRLSAVEALGRVNVACADKTGTMTKGRLQLSLVADSEQEARLTTTPADLNLHLRHILLTAALACPHPEAHDARAHPTDIAVMQGAIDAGLGQQLHIQHDAELPFDPMRSFHATLVQKRLSLKGAPEALLPRCRWLMRDGYRSPLDEEGRSALLHRFQGLAERGLRVLMVAEGSQDGSLDDPQDLIALGFVGISDPLRPTVHAAVKRCHEAGVRVIMITGDHPATARTIAREAGLLANGGAVLTTEEIAELQSSELDRRLEHAVVIARATPLDKVRIIESLQRQGHTIAMTGDGVNDAPALRLADVGVAVGGGSTEVARQTADVVITDDDFSTLVEAFVEGRSFWRNLRSALALLLGGNFAELGLVAVASILGVGSPLNIRQIFAVNAITDVFPALAVALQQPEHRNLARLQREGETGLGGPLRSEILRRGVATMVPALASYLLMLGQGVPQARSVAFASFVATQLAQTIEVSRLEGRLTLSVVGAVSCSVGVLLAAFTVPPLRAFLQLVVPSSQGWLLVAGGTLVALLLNRTTALPDALRWILSFFSAQPAARRASALAQ
ncbi:MAG: HAD-IC family P-type ATPase, partial [Ktedonobacteraceae bacterium]|nr:HAD-IC family P-type ATPase [Ktedonobacteraceae bacterium]